MNSTARSLRIVFDNAGGAVLFGRSYAHAYDSGLQLASDVISLLAGGDVSQWDGNDEELLAGMRKEDLNGYESAYTLAEIAGILAKGYTVKVDEDDVTVEGRHISGYTERRFWKFVSAK